MSTIFTVIHSLNPHHPATLNARVNMESQYLRSDMNTGELSVYGNGTVYIHKHLVLSVHTIIFRFNDAELLILNSFKRTKNWYIQY